MTRIWLVASELEPIVDIESEADLNGTAIGCHPPGDIDVRARCSAIGVAGRRLAPLIEGEVLESYFDFEIHDWWRLRIAAAPYANPAGNTRQCACRRVSESATTLELGGARAAAIAADHLRRGSQAKASVGLQRLCDLVAHIIRQRRDWVLLQDFFQKQLRNLRTSPSVAWVLCRLA